MKFINPWDPQQETDSQNTQSNESQSPSNEVPESSNSNSPSNETSGGSFWDTLSDIAEGFVEAISNLGNSVKNEAERILETEIVSSNAVYTFENAQLIESSKDIVYISTGLTGISEEIKLKQIWLKYDGTTLNIYNSVYLDETGLINTYPATSGLENLQIAKYESIKYACIPEGEYRVDLTKNFLSKARILHSKNSRTGDDEYDLYSSTGVQLIPWYDSKFPNVTFPGWGQWRARLEKVTTKSNNSQTRTRDNFYLHDSYKGYSHGCVETYTELYYDMAHWKKQGISSILLVVEYPNSETKTNGNTKQVPPPWAQKTNSGNQNYSPAQNAFPDRSKM